VISSDVSCLFPDFPWY